MKKTVAGNPLPILPRWQPSRRPWLAAALLALLPALPAHAAFPGTNGKIAFVSTRDGNFEIYVMNADGSSQTRLTTNPAFDDGPVWSPDGSRIAFRSNRDGNDEIYVMNADGSNPTRLTTNAASDRDPTWSPDGNRLAFRSDRDGNAEIYVMNADGSSQTRLTTNTASDVDPDWSPDGTRIAFGSNRDAFNNDIYVMNADGSNQTRLTTNTANDFEPAWSPDSNRLAFRSDRDGNNEIYVMDAGGSGQTRLTTNVAVDSQPAWSPSGNLIAFFSSRDGNQEIYVMNADGSNQGRLTNDAASDTGPNWQRIAPLVQVPLVRGIEGTSYLDTCALSQCLTPPDPSGAIGTTQFLEANNGSVAIYDKATGALVQRIDMSAFWSSVGLPGGALGNHRVLFDQFTDRWIVTGIGPTGNTRNLAISDSNDALGTWKSVRITVLPGGDFAFYGTLSVDEKAVYVSTANVDANYRFAGTSLLVIPKTDLFNGAPTLTNMTTFTTPYPGGPDRGTVIQVATNWQANPTNSAAVIAASRDFYVLVSYRLNGVDAFGATQTAPVIVPGSSYSITFTGRQPDGTRLIDLQSDIINTNAVQQDGLIYSTHAVRSSLGDFSAVRWTVVDAATGALRSSGLIEQAGYDFYQGSIAINQFGEVVIAYNRSGTAIGDGDGDGLADGNISLMARTYYVDVDTLVETGSELKLRVSGISDYHCGRRTPIDTTCRTRWGEYAALTVDPDNPRRFYALGSYASQWAVLPGGEPLGPRAIWNTYIAEIEPPAATDTDGDGVRDFADNCTLLANPTQCDSDADGYGNRCDGDLNNNGNTNAQDTTLYRQQLGQPSIGPTWNAADLNCNGAVNAQDTTLFRQRLGLPPGPSGVAP